MKGDFCLAPFGNVLHDHIDGYVFLCQAGEQVLHRAGNVGNVDHRDASFFLGECRAADRAVGALGQRYR